MRGKGVGVRYFDTTARQEPMYLLVHCGVFHQSLLLLVKLSIPTLAERLLRPMHLECD